MFVFVIFVVGVVQVWLDNRYIGSKQTSESFNTAGRSVKTGLIASVIVSQVTLQISKFVV